MKKRYFIILSLFLLLLSTAYAAEVKVSALTEATMVTSDDLLMLVDDPSGTPASKKISITNFLTGGGTLAIGQLFVWDGTKLAALAPGTDGYFLKTRGPGLLPEWAASSAGTATDLNLTGQSTGDIPYYNGSIWAPTKKISLGNDAAQIYDTTAGAYANADCTGPGTPAACCIGSGTGTCAPKKILIDPSGITPDKTVTIKDVATDNTTVTRNYTGNTDITYPTSGTLQTIKTEKLAVFNIPGDSADNTVVDAYVPVAATITGVLITTTGAACSAVVDIWADTYANFPATVADTITASAKPTLSTAQKNKDTTLTGWTKAISADSILRANLDSSDCAGLIQVTLIGTK